MIVINRRSLAAQRLKAAVLPAIVLGFLLFAASHAQAAGDLAVLDSVAQRFESAASRWSGTVTTAASTLFWSLATISMVYTFGFMALRRADPGEFFAEFLRFTIFTGFFWWLLSNAPAMATAIMSSLKQIGSQAIGESVSPSGIVDMGMEVLNKTANKVSFWEPTTALVTLALAVCILGVLALVAINMLTVLISGWILAYAGIFFLGFGGARWTSDMAVGYYKAVLGVGASLLAMTLIAGVGVGFVRDFTSAMAEPTIQELAVVLISALMLLVLVNKVPGMLAGLSGGNIAAATAGGAGAGTLVAGAALAGAAAAGVGVMAAKSAANIGGAAKLGKAAGAAASAARESQGGGGSSLADAMGGSGGPQAMAAGGSGASAAPQASGSSNAGGPKASGGQGGSAGGGSKAPGGQGINAPPDSKASPSKGSTSTAGQIAQSVKRQVMARAHKAMDSSAMGRMAGEIKEHMKSQAEAEIPQVSNGLDAEAAAEVAEFRDKKAA